ncbi:MAG TPA: hypothetical protein VMT95_00385 [Candidatus Binatia bacterium]|nr:hypothetical protein [Candidatus Binatia bacterium]
MNAFAIVALAVVAGVAAEIAIPGRGVYHAGWYNVALVALAILALVAARRRFRAATTPRARAAVVGITMGTAIVAIAGVASGLFGPDDQTIVGAPGQRVRVEGLGVLSFPLTASPASGVEVTLERPLRPALPIGTRPRDAGSFILRGVPRDVAYVEARDPRGGRLTVTQPLGAVFLSPVLLMQHRQNIAGLDLPFDSFNVPAARRVVKAVLFSPAQAAMLLHGRARAGEAAILFAVDDENERLLPHAIALSDGGRPVRAGGLLLSAMAQSYPAVEVVSAPNLIATALGTLLVFCAIVAPIGLRR